jgi:GTP-binding protein
MHRPTVNGTTKLSNVAIVGRPNVGKSALFNRLIGRKVAIVHDQPGITRDRISTLCTRGTRPFLLWDTGGIALTQSRDELTARVRRTVEQAINDSNVLLFVVDAREGLLPLDEELARTLRRARKPVVLVINKIDSEKHESLATDFATIGFLHSHSVSAEHNRGISELLDTIDQVLPLSLAAEDIKHQTSNSKPPLAIAIIGRPNVGKSSLVNSIVRGEQAIVSELPGTTRDAIDIFYQRDSQQFLFIDTAGIRRRGKRSSSVEVFSVMRAERSIRRADLCVLTVDLTAGVTAQDKRIAGLIQRERKAAIVVLNKWDLIRPKRNQRQTISQLVDEARTRIFFLEYAPVLIASALSGENIEKLFAFIEKIRRAARQHIGTGILNRLLRQVFEANPPPMVKGRRLKLFYATQAGGKEDRHLQPPEFVLFVNDPRLMNEGYRRYVETRIRKVEPYPGLPILLNLRARKPGRAGPA